MRAAERNPPHALSAYVIRDKIKAYAIVIIWPEDCRLRPRCCQLGGYFKHTSFYFLVAIYRVGQKSKLLILRKYVNITEKRMNVNKYEQLQRK